MSTVNLAKSSRGRTIAYWVTTLLLALECLAGGIIGALQRPPFIGIMKHLGYPGYVMTIIGVWYVLGGVALLLPRFPRLKEWAYAGLFFIYTGAIASRLAVGDSVVALMGPIILTGLVIASSALRPSTRRLTTVYEYASVDWQDKEALVQQGQRRCGLFSANRRSARTQSVRIIRTEGNPL